MDTADRFLVSPDVVTQEVGCETVLLDLTSETYFGLDPVGSRIWSLLRQGKCLAELYTALEEEFDVLPATSRRDTVLLIEELLARGLLTLA